MFGGISHDENRHAVGRTLFLDSAGVGQAQIRTRLKVVAIKQFNRFDDVNLLAVLPVLLQQPGEQQGSCGSDTQPCNSDARPEHDG